MGAPLGNQFWKLRSKHGRDKLFEHPDKLWEAACEYFEWCENNPLMEAEQAKSASKAYVDDEGKVTYPPNFVELPKMRAFTWDGLELYIDIFSLRKYKTKEEYKDFEQVITRIERVIYNQKFTGAAAGFLNPNIIARDLGLRDSQTHEVTGKDGGALEHRVTHVHSNVPLANSEDDVEL